MPPLSSSRIGRYIEAQAPPGHSRVDYMPGDMVPWHFIPGIMVASFFASLSGTLLTIELLHRKRLGKSLISRVHLFACSVSMGLIGIWCMHYIGNRSITMSHGEEKLQLVYSPGYTGLSCVCPVLGLTIGFNLTELHVRSPTVRRLLDGLAGLLAGVSIVGMHYIGNLGAMNYTLIYPPRFIVAACIIAIGDSTIALSLFFYFKDRWINVFWKRLLCAVLLAIGVCGMHFTASIGCNYKLNRTPNATAKERNTPVIIAATLNCVAAISVLLVLFYTQYRKRILADRAQQVMLVCAFFDEHGNIMVTNEGTLPSQRIAKRFALQKFDDHFGVHHAVFHWIWKVSHDWESVADLIPKMGVHLQKNNPYLEKTSKSKSNSSSVVYDEQSDQDPTIIFREGFCVAASDLAAQLQAPLDQLGVLFDEVSGTGLLTAYAYRRDVRSLGNNGAYNCSLFEKGQVVFFTRNLRPEQTDHYSDAGFRFAPVNRVESMIAKTMQVPVSLLNNQMGRLHRYAQRKSTPPPPKTGTYFVCLAALARVRSTFMVLVPSDRQEELPDVQLMPHNPSLWQMEYLKNYDGWPAEKFIKAIERKDKNREKMNEDEKSFVMTLRDALAALVERLGEEWFLELVFSAEPLLARYGALKAQKPGTTVAFGFSRLLDIHQVGLSVPGGMVLADWDFVRMRQNYYPGCNDHGRLRHEVHTEFGPFLTKQGSQEPRTRSVDSKKGILGRITANLSRDSNALKPHQSRDADTSEGEWEPIETCGGSGKKQPWGGILATTNTVIVETSEMEDGMEMGKIEPRVTARATAVGQHKEPGSYMEALYAQAKSHSTHGPKS